MTGLAAARVSFAESGLLRELAGLDIDAKLAERQAEALGREIAVDERQRRTATRDRPDPLPRPRRNGRAGAQGRDPGPKGQAAGRVRQDAEAKIVAAWSADTLDRDGRPARDPGSVT